MNTNVPFGSRDYEARHEELVRAKRLALGHIVGASYAEVRERLLELLSPVTPAAAAGPRREGEDPALVPVIDYSRLLDRAHEILAETRRRFSPCELHWTQTEPSLHAAFPDFDGRNPALAAVAGTYDPLFRKNDRARLRAILRGLAGGAAEVTLTGLEEGRLFLPLSGRPVLSFDQLFQRGLLLPQGGREHRDSGEVARTFTLEPPTHLERRRVSVQWAPPEWEHERGGGGGRNRYLVRTEAAPGEGSSVFRLDVGVGPESETLCQALFEGRQLRNAFRDLGAAAAENPLAQPRTGRMWLPILREVLVLRGPLGALVPVAAVAGDEWLREHAFTPEELGRMKR